MRRLHQLLRNLRSLFTGRPHLPEDPYAYVIAPRKPRNPHLCAAAVADLPEE